jgi:hypothetical protein
MVPPVVVVHKADERCGQTNYHNDQQDYQNCSQASVHFAEFHAHDADAIAASCLDNVARLVSMQEIALGILHSKTVVASADSKGGQAQADEGARRDNRSAKCAHFSSSSRQKIMIRV